MPSWAYHSPITGQQRIAAVAKLQVLLHKAARGNATIKRADALLHDAGIVEPLGEDASGADAVRYLVAPKKRNGHWFAVMPVYAPDAKASTTLRELVKAKPTPAVGLDEDQPIVYVRVDGPALKKWLPMIATTIVACFKS